MDAELHRPTPNFREWHIPPAIGHIYSLTVTMQFGMVIIRLTQVGQSGEIYAWSRMLDPSFDEQAQCLNLLHQTVSETDQALRAQRLTISRLSAFADGMSTLFNLSSHLWSMLLSRRANSGFPDPPDGLTLEFTRLRHVDLTAGTLLR